MYYGKELVDKVEDFIKNHQWNEDLTMEGLRNLNCLNTLMYNDDGTEKGSHEVHVSIEKFVEIKKERKTVI
eukprot:UN11549